MPNTAGTLAAVGAAQIAVGRAGAALTAVVAAVAASPTFQPIAQMHGPWAAVKRAAKPSVARSSNSAMSPCS
jgi:hypothetical protein